MAVTDGMADDVWLSARAGKIYAMLRASPHLAPWQRSLVFRPSLRRLARSLAYADLALEFVSDVSEAHGMDAVCQPPMPGISAPIEVFVQAEQDAGRMRAEFGLSPLAYARIMKDLGPPGTSAR